MDFLIDFLKTNLLQLLNLLILTIFGAAGWRIVQESKKNLEERYKAELAKRDVEVTSLTNRTKDLLAKHQAEQAERQVIHQAEITARDGEIDRQKTRVETLEQQSVSKATETINYFKEYAQNVENLLEESKLDSEEKNRIIEELNRELERSREEVGDVQRLIELLHSDSVNVRASAANVLGQIDEPAKEVISALIQALNDDSDSVRFQAAGALGGIGESAKEAVPALIQVFKNSNGLARLRSGEALSRIGEPAVPALIQTLKDGNNMGRHDVADALGAMGEPAKEAIPALIEVLEDDSEWVRRSAASALKQIATPEALKTVEEYEKRQQE